MSEAHDEQVGRRNVLKTAVGLAGASVVAGASGTAAAQSSLDSWFSGDTGGETKNYDGIVDKTGNDSVTVEVGADGNGGPYAFSPAAVRVDPGATVKFTWVSNTHNIMIESQPSGAGWKGHSSIESKGFEYEHTFKTEGTYKYYCQPHLALGMKGAIVVGSGGGGGGGGGGETATEGGAGAGGGGGGAGGEGGTGEAGAKKGGPLANFHSLMVGGTLVVAFLSPILFGLFLLFGSDEGEKGQTHGQ